MRKIVEVREGLLGNLFAIVLLISLAGFTSWAFHRDHYLRLVGYAFGLAWLSGCILFVRNILNPKESYLGIEGDRLVWSVRNTESAAATVTDMPLKSLRRLEFVLPKMKFHVKAKNYPLSELFLVDVHMNRHRLPMELWPGVHRDKIVTALKGELPELEVVERVDGSSNARGNTDDNMI